MSAQALQEFFVSLGFEVDTAKINEFEQQTARLRDGLLKVGTIMTGAAAGVGAMVLKVAEGMDEIGDFADIIGMSAKEVDALSKVAKQNDSSFDAMKSTLQGVAQVTGEAAMGIGRGAAIFEKLGLAAKDAEGKTKGAGTMLAEIADRMKDMAEGDRLALASKLHIDPSLLPLLSKGSKAFMELKESAEAANPLTEGQYKQADEIVKLWGKATASVGGYTKLLAVKLFPVMKNILTSYNDWVSSVKKGGGGLIADAFKLASAFAEALWNWIERVASGVKSAFTELKEFKVVTWAAGAAVAALIAYQAGIFFTTLGGAVMTAARALFTFNASVALPVILVGGLVIAIGLLVDELVNFYEGNETIIGQLSEEFPGAIYGAWAALATLGAGFLALKWKAITSIVQMVAYQWWLFTHAQGGIAKMLVGFSSLAWGWLSTAATATASAVRMAASWFIALGPIGWVVAAVIAAAGLIWAYWDELSSWIGPIWDKAMNAVMEGVSQAVSWVTELFDNAKQKVVGFIDMVTGAIGKVGQLLGLTSDAKDVKVEVSKTGQAQAVAQAPESGLQQSDPTRPRQMTPVAQAMAQAPAMQNAFGDSQMQTPTTVPTPQQRIGAIGRAGSTTTNSTTVMQTTQVTGTTIQISSPDPAKAGEAVRQELDKMNKQTTRNGQSAVAL